MRVLAFRDWCNNLNHVGLGKSKDLKTIMSAALSRLENGVCWPILDLHYSLFRLTNASILSPQPMQGGGVVPVCDTHSVYKCVDMLSFQKHDHPFAGTTSSHSKPILYICTAQALASSYEYNPIKT